MKIGIQYNKKNMLSLVGGYGRLPHEEKNINQDKTKSLVIFFFFGNLPQHSQLI